MNKGEQLRERGQQLALDAQPDWRTQADETIMQLARSGNAFTSEDVTARIGLPSVGTNKNNAVGAVIAVWARRGLIHDVGWTRTSNPQGHSRKLTIWRGHALES